MTRKNLTWIFAACLLMGLGTLACKDGSSDGCFLNSDCYDDKVDDGTKVCNRTTKQCELTVKGMCSDGTKNNAETDVDCGGGLCAMCETGKSCAQSTDCKSLQCVDNVCTGEAVDCVAPSEGDLIVNEIMSSPSKTVDFPNCTGVLQNEFIEIVNVSDKPLELKDVVINSNQELKYKFSKEHCLLPKHAAVVYATAPCELPHVYSVVKGGEFPLLNGSAHLVEILYNDMPISTADTGTGKPGISTQRKPDITGTEFLLHNEVSDTLSSSPGMCSNGFAIVNECKAPDTCSDGIKSGDETDVDCGGSCPQKCENNKSCKNDSDCYSLSCVNNVCEVPDCEPPRVNDLLINEILLNQGVVIDANKDGEVNDRDKFIEIVNNTDKRLALGGVKIIQSKKTERYTFKSSACIDPYGAAVVFNNTNEQDAEDIKEKLGGAGNVEVYTDGTLAFAQSTADAKHIHLEVNSTVINAVEIGTATAAGAWQRKPDYGKNNILVARSSLIPGEQIFATPGLCSTGGKLAPKCAVLPVGCDDEIKNQDESDVDCGGSCGLCEVGKACNTFADCRSSSCEEGVCTGIDCVKPEVGEIIINEVFPAPITSGDFISCSGVRQNEFIEFFNDSDKMINLHDIAVSVNGNIKDPYKFENICINPKSAFVLYATAKCNQDDVLGIVNGKDFSITNNKEGSIVLYDGATKLAEAKWSSNKNGISVNRDPDLMGGDDFINHNEMEEIMSGHSPGTCADGGSLALGCPPPMCKNETHDPDNGETDVDCGGPNCDACGTDANCKENEDCLSNECSGGKCTAEPSAPVAGELVINEVLPAPSTSVDFENCTGVKQNEYVEFVNVSDQKINLEGMELYTAKAGETLTLYYTFAKIILEPKQALVLYEKDKCNDGEALWVSSGKTNMFTNNVGYDLSLRHNGVEISKADYPTPASGVSVQRSPDTGSDTLVRHNAIDGITAKHSPGSCVNGANFSTNCL
ncbi:MAG: lamin tail domain-containing protein [Bradymonadia bacterium]|jgi:hypothetical protein